MSIQFPMGPGPEDASRPVRKPRSWMGFLAGGIILAAGVGMVVWPVFSATWMLGVLVGVALLVNGLTLMVRGGAAVIGGALLAILGVCSILLPEAIATALVTFTGIGFLVLGAIWVAFASRFAGAAATRAAGRGAGKLAALVPGILLIAGGIVALIWPSLALGVVAVIGGLCLIALGAFIIWVTKNIRRGGPASQTTIII